MNQKLHPRRIHLALPLAVLLPAASPLAAQQPADSGTRFLPPNELRRAMQENYVPEPTPEPTPIPEKNPTLGVEDRIQIQALFSAAESLRSQGKGLEAAAYYQQAAAKGDTTSLLRLADLYAGYAEGMVPDPALSEKYLRAAAAKNNRTASIRLAEIYHDGIGQKPDADKAASFYRQAMAPGAPRGAQDEVIAAAAALLQSNRKINDEDFKRILKMVRTDRAGKPADRATILLAAVAMVEAEKGRQNLVPKETEEPAQAKTTPPKFSEPTLVEELLADQTLTIDSALAELDQAGSDPALPKLQHRAALLLASAPPAAEGTTSRADELFQAAGTAELQAARFRIDKPTAESIKKNLASTGDYGRSALADGSGNSTDSDSIAMIEAAAEAGDPDAQYELGQLWLQGIDRQKNEWRAFQAFQKSATGGNTNAIHMLGRCYARGIGTGINRRNAAHLYSLAAAKGQPEAMYGFAKALENGRGIPQDPVASASWLTKAADAGVAAANIELAKKALNPESETDRIDIPAASRRYLAAARADDNGAQLEFLKIVFASNPESDAAPTQLFGASGEEILEWSQDLATNKTLTEKQRRLASYYQARCLATGLGTTQDLDQASKLFVTLSGKPLPQAALEEKPEPTPEPSPATPVSEVNKVNEVPSPTPTPPASETTESDTLSEP